MIVRSYLSCIIQSYLKVFWYDLRNDGTDPHNFEDNIGIMYKDFSPKPAYIAYSTMTRTLKGMKFVHSLTMPEGIYSGLFEDLNDSNKKVIAVWSPSEDRSLEIEIPFSKAILINTIGEKTELKVNAREMKNFINVQLKKGSPVYIR